jgi:adenine-specific DNA-methyltransferase
MPTTKQPAPLSKTRRTNSGRFTNLDQDKLRGGYYTSKEVAQWLCSWAIRSTKDLVLEPSSGDGSFLCAAAERYLELGARRPTVTGRLKGVEVIAKEANQAREALRELLGPAANKIVEVSDFFSWFRQNTALKFDAVIGNPPFIRYQSFPEPHRTLAMELMTNEGLSPNRLTNIWVPFVVAAVAALRKEGRLGMVLPAELLQVGYAAQLRAFLTDRFKRIDIIACNELFFEKAEQEVVLLLADGLLPGASDTNLCRVTMSEARTVEEIVGQQPEVILAAAKPKSIRHDNEKWLKYFLTEREIAFMRELRDSGVAMPLSTHGSVDVGVVTGKNEFFVLTGAQIAEFDLGGYTVPLVSRSAHLKGARVSKADWRAMSESGDRVHLLNLKPVEGAKFSDSLRKYIRHGERQQVHTGYKCSIRKPWYEVPSVWVSDGFLFRQIYDFPRVVLNQSGATATDTIHRLSVRGGDPKLMIANTYSWLTAASAEIEGRSYGGGVLELEPTESEKLLMPAELKEAMPLAECDRLIRSGGLDQVLEENARVILRGNIGLSQAECLLLRGIWTKMRDRRMARSKASRRGLT